MLRLTTVALIVALLLAGAVVAQDDYTESEGEMIAAVTTNAGVGADEWTATVGFLRQTIDAHSAAVSALAVTPDGSTLFTGGKDGHFKVWDLATGELLQDVPACQARINDIAISPDSTYVVTAAEDGYVKAWDMVTAELLVALPAHLGGPENSGAVGRENQTIRSFEGTVPRFAAERVPAVISANAVAISPDGLFFYTAGDDGYIRKYSVEENYLQSWEVFADFGGVNDIALNSTGQYLFAGGVDGYVNIYNAELGILESQYLAVEQGEVLSLALSNNESCILTGGSNGEMRIWDASTGSLVRKVNAHRGDVTWVGSLSDDSMVLSNGQDGMLRVWNWDGEKLGELKAHLLTANETVIQDCTLVTGGDDYKVRLWDANFPGCIVAPVIEPEIIYEEPLPVEPVIDEPELVIGNG